MDNSIAVITLLIVGSFGGPRSGEPEALVQAGVPMMLTGTGNTVRRSLVLILQDATLPRSTPARNWTPLGLCGD